MSNIFCTVFLLFSISMLGACASPVHVTVNSLRSKDRLSKQTPIVFVKTTEDISVEKMRKQCMKGALKAEMDVRWSCKEGCLWARIEGETGGSAQVMSTSYNYYTGLNEVSSQNVTDRKMKIVIFEDPELKKIAYQSVLDSSGGSKNILSVAAEMCEAAFKAFPYEYTGQLFRISSGN